MGIVGGVWLFLLGVLGAANLIIARKPEAKELIDKIAPYQGWMGFGSMWWGLWGIVWFVLGLGNLKHWPVFWITFGAASTLHFLLGTLLGVGTFKTFVKQEQAVQKVDQLVLKLAPMQGTLGLIGIVTGIWLVIANFIRI